MKIVERIQGSDKSISVRMAWIVGGFGKNYTITRRIKDASVNASSRAQRTVEWSITDPSGHTLNPPSNVRKHEVSIARWILKMVIVETLGKPGARMYNWSDHNNRPRSIYLTIHGDKVQMPKRIVDELEADGLLETEGVGHTTYWSLSNTALAKVRGE